MELGFFKIWFIVSSFIMLYLFLKNRDYKNRTSNIINQINDVWDNEYKQIILLYGSTENFIESHTNDFNIIRENLTAFYQALEFANFDFIKRTENLLKLYRFDKDISNSKLIEFFNEIRRMNIDNLEKILNTMHAFIESEESAHSNSKTAIEVLDKIDAKYKDDLYKKVCNELKDSDEGKS